MGLREDVMGEVEAAFVDADKWRELLEELEELGFTVAVAEDVVRIVQAMRVDDYDIDVTTTGDAADGNQIFIDSMTGASYTLPWRIGEGGDCGHSEAVVVVSEAEPRRRVTGVTTGAERFCGGNGSGMLCGPSEGVFCAGLFQEV
jgi:hypothetical protein